MQRVAIRVEHLFLAPYSMREVFPLLVLRVGDRVDGVTELLGDVLANTRVAVALGVEFQAIVAEPNGVEALLHLLQRGLLLGDEQNPLVVRETRRDEVCDRLRLAGAGWSFET